MRINILGGANEVGRSAIELDSDNSKILLDYGVLISGKEPRFPLTISPKHLDAIILTHSHLDHSGGIPLLYMTTKPKLLTTQLTLEISELLIKDFIRISSYYLPYELLELKSMLQHAKSVEINDMFKLKDLNITILSAGHIPGSIMALIECQNKRILYTGDFNTRDTQILNGAKINFPKLDAIIMEGTYATVNHEDRLKIENDFIVSVENIVNNGGIVLVPAFSVGRSQEILCVLYKYKINAPVYIDGMAKDASEIMLKHPRYFRDYKLLIDAHKSAIWIDTWSKRRKACRNPGIIVTPAGMLKGGNARFYMKKLAKEEKNAVFLVSYQITGTPGALLLEKGIYNFGNGMEKVKAKVEWYNFSSHCGNRELLETIKTNQVKKVILVHGEKEKLENFQKMVQEEKIAEEVIIPKAGEEILI